MDKFRELLMKKETMGYVYRLANESKRMLAATLKGDTYTMAEILKLAHDTEAPIFSYNSEIELSAVVNLVYLAARDRYRVEREDKAGEGYVDFHLINLEIFYWIFLLKRDMIISNDDEHSRADHDHSRGAKSHCLRCEKGLYLS